MEHLVTNLKAMNFFSEMFVLKTAYPSVACFAEKNVLSEPSFALVVFPSFIYNSFLYKYASNCCKDNKPLKTFQLKHNMALDVLFQTACCCLAAW